MVCLCGVVKKYQRLGGIYCLLLQGRRVFDSVGQSFIAQGLFENLLTLRGMKNQCLTVKVLFSSGKFYFLLSDGKNKINTN
jgi:hypothetical protein